VVPAGIAPAAHCHRQDGHDPMDARGWLCNGSGPADPGHAATNGHSVAAAPWATLFRPIRGFANLPAAEDTFDVAGGMLRRKRF